MGIEFNVFLSCLVLGRMTHHVFILQRIWRLPQSAAVRKEFALLVE